MTKKTLIKIFRYYIFVRVFAQYQAGLNSQEAGLEILKGGSLCEL